MSQEFIDYNCNYYTKDEGVNSGNFIDSAVDRPWEIWAEQAKNHAV